MNVVSLGPPDRPRDGGLASLGVVMMASALACGALAWCAAVVAVVDLMGSMVLSEGEPAHSLLAQTNPLVCVLAIGLTINRGALAYRAGRALATGAEARVRLGAYTVIGLLHAATIGWLLRPVWPAVELAALVGVLAVQPLAAIAIAPRARAAPRTGAREAVPVLALLGGVVALVLAGALLVPGLHLAHDGLGAAGDRYALVPPLQVLLVLGTGLGFIAVALAIGISIVGALMIRAGVGGPAALDHAVRASSFIAFVITIAVSLLVLTVVAIPAIVALGMAFPQLLQRVADAEAPRPHDPGARRAALGWILLGHGLLALAGLLPAALTGTATSFAACVAAAPGVGWSGVGLALVELAAALALMSGNRTARLLVLVWSGCVVVATVDRGAPPVLAAWFLTVPFVALIASSPLTETLRARARPVRSLGA